MAKNIKSQKKKEALKGKTVVQKNELLDGDTSAFDTADLKLFRLIISKVNSKETLFSDFYHLTQEELKALLDYSKNLYSEVSRGLKNLANMYVKIENSDGSYREVGLIKNDFIYNKGGSGVSYSFNDDMQGFLLDIAKGFTQYPLLDIVDLKLKHSIKLYEMLKRLSFDYIEYRLDTLKAKMELTSKYKQYYNFKRQVLIPCVNEINEHSETISIEFVEIKNGARVEKIGFKIERHEGNKTKKDGKYSYLTDVKCFWKEREYVFYEINNEQYELKIRDVLNLKIKTFNFLDDASLEEGVKKLFNIEAPSRVIDAEIVDPKEESKQLVFKGFKKQTISKFSGKFVINGVPGYEYSTTFSLNEAGFIVNDISGKSLSKEDAMTVWRYMHMNSKSIGKYRQINECIIGSDFQTPNHVFKVNSCKKTTDGFYRIVGTSPSGVKIKIDTDFTDKTLADYMAKYRKKTIETI